LKGRQVGCKDKKKRRVRILSLHHKRGIGRSNKKSKPEGFEDNVSKKLKGKPKSETHIQHLKDAWVRRKRR
jgi:hypothetical protein